MHHVLDEGDKGEGDHKRHRRDPIPHTLSARHAIKPRALRPEFRGGFPVALVVHLADEY